MKGINNFRETFISNTHIEKRKEKGLPKQESMKNIKNGKNNSQNEINK